MRLCHCLLGICELEWDEAPAKGRPECRAAGISVFPIRQSDLCELENGQ